MPDQLLDNPNPARAREDSPLQQVPNGELPETAEPDTELNPVSGPAPAPHVSINRSTTGTEQRTPPAPADFGAAHPGRGRGADPDLCRQVHPDCCIDLDLDFVCAGAGGGLPHCAFRYRAGWARSSLSCSWWRRSLRPATSPTAGQSISYTSCPSTKPESSR